MHRDMPGMKRVNGHELPPPAPCRIPVSSSAIAPSPTSLSSSVIVLGGERLFRTAAERRLFRSECPGFVRLRLFVGLDEASGICDEVVSALIGSSLLRFCGGAGSSVAISSTSCSASMTPLVVARVSRCSQHWR